MGQLNFQKAISFEAVDVTFHGRNLHPTETWDRAVAKADAKGSKIVRVYGTPTFLIDTNTLNVYLAHQFSKDITEKIVSGTLVIPKGVQVVIDQETQDRIKNKEKRHLKNSTKVYRKR